MAFPFFFRMTFTGLCAFVPRQGGPEGSVLLVNTEDLADDLNFHSTLHAHEPRVWLQGQPISLRGKILSYSVANAATIEPSVLQPVEIQLPTPPPTKPTPGTDQQRGIYWISNMGELEGGSVDDTCFGTLPNKKVVARVKLSAGFLSTSRIVKSLSGDDLEWNFKKSRNSNKAPIVRAMAAEFSLIALVNGTEIQLNLFDPTTGLSSTYALSPVGGEVMVQVENSCFCDDPEGPLEDFALFYRLSQARGAIHLPYRAAGGDLSDTLCPPARFPPHLSA